MGKHAEAKAWDTSAPETTPSGGTRQYRNYDELSLRAVYPVVQKPKDMGIAYLLWFAGGPFGAHRYYLNRKGSAKAMTITSLTLIGLVVTAVWAIVDLFLIPGIFREETKPS